MSASEVQNQQPSQITAVSVSQNTIALYNSEGNPVADFFGREVTADGEMWKCDHPVVKVCNIVRRESTSGEKIEMKFLNASGSPVADFVGKVISFDDIRKIVGYGSVEPIVDIPDIEAAQFLTGYTEVMDGYRRGGLGSMLAVFTDAYCVLNGYHQILINSQIGRNDGKRYLDHFQIPNRELGKGIYYYNPKSFVNTNNTTI